LINSGEYGEGLRDEERGTERQREGEEVKRRRGEGVKRKMVENVDGPGTKSG
jgi:hypothetical protein